jgi:hypothetical protein
MTMSYADVLKKGIELERTTAMKTFNNKPSVKLNLSKMSESPKIPSDSQKEDEFEEVFDSDSDVEEDGDISEDILCDDDEIYDLFGQE